MHNVYKSFVRGGASLDENKKEKLRDIDQNLSVLGPAFMNNVTKSAEQFELVIEDEKDLSGIPENAVAGAKQAAQEKDYEGKWLFTLDVPSFSPFIQYADNRELRKKIWRAFSSRAWKNEFDNSETILEIVKLRYERAQLLGYDTHADFVLERRMAETPDQVWKFLKKLKKIYKPAAQKDLEQLQKFAKENDGLDDLQPWDVAYYSEKLKQKLFDFSSEDLRPYFPLDRVLQGCFDHFSKLFNLRFERSDKYPVWHPDITAYEVFDETANEFLGTLYADFQPLPWRTQFPAHRDRSLFDIRARIHPRLCRNHLLL